MLGREPIPIRPGPRKRIFTREDKLKAYENLVRQETELLGKMKGYRDANRIEFFDKAPNPGPNPKQAEILEAWLDPYYKVFTMSGGNRLGKTTLDILIAICTMAGKYLWDGRSLLHLFPHKEPRKIRYVGQDWEKHIKAVVMPELEKWWPKNRPVKTKKNNVGIDAYWKDEKTGSTLEIMSNGQESELHEGWSGDLIVYDEPPRRDIRVANARGLVDRLGRELFCMTLLKEAWIDREVIKKVLPDGRPDRTVFNVKGESYDNVGYGITKEGLDQFASKLTEDEIEARLKGIPSYMSGLVYPTFERKLHHIKRFKIPLDWMVDIAIDIHPRERQAVLFVATDSRNDRYVCDEIWDHGDGVWVGEEIVRRVKYHGYRVNHLVIDPLSKGDQNSQDTTFDKIYRVLSAHDLVMHVASKDKTAGILEVKKHLKGPNGRPSMFFFDDLVRTMFEIEGYMWDQETQKPQDKDDHMMENLYRICLINTQYIPIEDEFYGRMAVGSSYGESRDRVTGY